VHGDFCGAFIIASDETTKKLCSTGIADLAVGRIKEGPNNCTTNNLKVATDVDAR
jgi:hypothetical protein